ASTRAARSAARTAGAFRAARPTARRAGSARPAARRAGAPGTALCPRGRRSPTRPARARARAAAGTRPLTRRAPGTAAAALLAVAVSVIAVAEQLLADGDRGRHGHADRGARGDLLPCRHAFVAVFHVFHLDLLYAAVSCCRSPR